MFVKNLSHFLFAEVSAKRRGTTLCVLRLDMLSPLLCPAHPRCVTQAKHQVISPIPPGADKEPCRHSLSLTTHQHPPTCNTSHGNSNLFWFLDTHLSHAGCGLHFPGLPGDAGDGGHAPGTTMTSRTEIWLAEVPVASCTALCDVS